MPILLSFSVLSNSLTAVEYGILHINREYGVIPTDQKYNVTLAEGDKLEILSAYSNFSYDTTRHYLKVFCVSEDFPPRNSWGVNGNWITLGVDSFYPDVTEVIGPCEIFINYIIEDTRYLNPENTAFINYKLTRASEVEYKQANIISIAEDTVGDGTQIVVDASSDLQTWTPVHSSTVSGDKAFFRTRVVTSGE